MRARKANLVVGGMSLRNEVRRGLNLLLLLLLVGLLVGEMGNSDGVSLLLLLLSVRVSLLRMLEVLRMMLDLGGRGRRTAVDRRGRPRELRLLLLLHLLLLVLRSSLSRLLLHLLSVLKVLSCELRVHPPETSPNLDALIVIAEVLRALVDLGVRRLGGLRQPNRRL